MTKFNRFSIPLGTEYLWLNRKRILISFISSSVPKQILNNWDSLLSINILSLTGQVLENGDRKNFGYVQ